MPENCKSCSEPMVVLKWNSSVDALVCNNSSCGLFRRPTQVPKGSTTLAEELGKMYGKRKRLKRPTRRDISASLTFEERLQELRDEVSA